MPSDPVIFDRASADKIASAVNIVLRDTEAGPFGWKTPRGDSRSRSAFVVYPTSGAKVKITGGVVHHVYLRATDDGYGTGAIVADSAEITLTNGDDVWLEMQGEDFDTGGIKWAFNWTSSGVSPVTPIRIMLWKAVVITTGQLTGKVVKWHGGDIIFPTTFVGMAIQTGGSAGGGGGSCSFTYDVYTVTDSGGDVVGEYQLLGEDLTPTTPRIPGVKYSSSIDADGSASTCLCYLTSKGVVRLAWVAGELPLTQTKSLVTSVDFVTPDFTSETLTVFETDA